MGCFGIQIETCGPNEALVVSGDLDLFVIIHLNFEEKLGEQ